MVPRPGRLRRRRWCTIVGTRQVTPGWGGGSDRPVALLYLCECNVGTATLLRARIVSAAPPAPARQLTSAPGGLPLGDRRLRDLPHSVPECARTLRESVTTSTRALHHPAADPRRIYDLRRSRQAVLRLPVSAMPAPRSDPRGRFAYASPARRDRLDSAHPFTAVDVRRSTSAARASAHPEAGTLDSLDGVCICNFAT